MKIMIDLSKVNWGLLIDQKYYLLDNAIKKGCDQDIIDGIVNLLDDIQDQAAEQIGEEKVFGKEE